MGNQACCQLPIKDQNRNQVIHNSDYHPQILPQLSQPIKNLLIDKKPFQKQLNTEYEIITRQYSNQFYEGPVDIANRPNGYGKMYKSDGSLVISHFKEGKSEGPSIYIFPDGSYYEGYLKNNQAQDINGRFFSQQLQYSGGFFNNLFEGHGREQGQNYSFQGQYKQGQRFKGNLKWKQQASEYQYAGQFDLNQKFTGEGQLKEEQIGTFRGTFLSGKKQGKGTYQYLNGMKYDGQYKNGLKHGFGTIFNYDTSVAYSGQFANDLPNGKGFIIEDGKKIYATFLDGIDILTLA